YVEAVYSDYARNPSEVPASWRSYFASLNGDRTVPREVPVSREDNVQRDDTTRAALGTVPFTTCSPDNRHSASAATQARLDSLVWAFRAWGHLAADVDPLGLRGVGESFWANLHPTAQLTELSLDLHNLDD